MLSRRVPIGIEQDDTNEEYENEDHSASSAQSSMTRPGRYVIRCGVCRSITAEAADPPSATHIAKLSNSLSSPKLRRSYLHKTTCTAACTAGCSAVHEWSEPVERRLLKSRHSRVTAEATSNSPIQPATASTVCWARSAISKKSGDGGPV